MSRRPVVDQDALLRLALETKGSTRTVRRWLMGQPVSAFAEYALQAAAEKLQLQPDRMKLARVRRRRTKKR
jgi:hypothetical protein